jgi:hypothetical protein
MQRNAFRNQKASDGGHIRSRVLVWSPLVDHGMIRAVLSLLFMLVWPPFNTFETLLPQWLVLAK